MPILKGQRMFKHEIIMSATFFWTVKHSTEVVRFQILTAYSSDGAPNGNDN